MSTMKSVRWMFVPKHTHTYICTAHQHMHTIQHHRYGNKRRAFYIHAHPIKWPSSLNSRVCVCVYGKHTQIKWKKTHTHTELWIIHGFSHIHEMMCCHRGINFFHSVLWVCVCVCDLVFFIQFLGHEWLVVTFLISMFHISHSSIEIDGTLFIYINIQQQQTNVQSKLTDIKKIDSINKMHKQTNSKETRRKEEKGSEWINFEKNFQVHFIEVQIGFFL